MTMIPNHLISPRILAAALALACAAVAAADQFTYQGKLLENGIPVNGDVDLRLTLYRGPDQGDAIVAGPITLLGVTVNEGLLTTDVDFGPAVFDGNERWIGLEVASPAGSATFIPLNPRQEVTPAPYAMHAMTVGSLPTSYAGAINFTNATNQFSGSGSGLTGLNAANIAAGFLPDDRLRGTYTNILNLSHSGNVYAGNGASLTNLNWANLVNVPAGFADGVDNGGEWLLNGSTVYYLNGRVGVGTNAPSGPGGTARVGVATSTDLIGIYATNTYDDPLFLNAAIRGDGLDIGGLFVATGSTGRAIAATAQPFSGTTYGLRVTGNSPDGYGVWSSSPGWAGYFVGDSYFSGDVGIGTTSPNAKLEVESTTNAVRGMTSGPGAAGVSAYSSLSSGTGFGIISEVDSADSWSGFFLGGKNYFQGNVGVGILSPELKLQVTGGSDVEPGFGGYFAIGLTSGGNLGFDTNEIMARDNGSTATLYLNNDGGDVSISAAGNGKLITPIIQITGGSDLSEKFDVASADDVVIEPGMVVCIDPANPGRLMLSRDAYAHTVAGIISGAGGVNTGMMMGQEGSIADGSMPVALTGRVYCYVDATNHAVIPGDLLTTSDVPGHAMKVADTGRAHGAIIGKAMTSLEQGERGLVLVLVSLH